VAGLRLSRRFIGRLRKGNFSMSTILIVCTGNLCRSPMGMGLLRRQLAEEGLDGMHRVISAGVWAQEGRAASENAVLVMQERGIDISDHVSRPVTASLVAEADLILAMSHEHKRVIDNTWPQYAWKTFLLSEMMGRKSSVEDPYGGPIEEYRLCADIISDYIDQGMGRIVELL
jgi:protein-tyrosine-phosphatase